MSPISLGVLAAVLASAMWGVSPLYFSELRHVPPPELLAHRIVWATLVVGLYCAVTGRLGRVREALSSRAAVLALMLSASLITVNWFTFLTAVQAGNVTGSGLGYYLMPLVSVAIGVVFLRERLDRRQWCAVGLAGLAVALLSYGLGAAPWVPITVALSFSLYGLVRKRIATGAIVGFQVESLLLLPVALAVLGTVHMTGWDLGTGRETGLFGSDLRTTLGLIAAGPITGVPLILFAEAARRLPYATTGLIQYVNPSPQVAGAGLILGEAFTPWHWGALALIWVALALYSSALLGQERAARRAAMASSGVSTTVS